MKPHIPLVIVLILVLPAASLLAKPTPPPNLLNIFSQLSELEEELEKGDWPEALTLTKETEDLFDSIHPELERARPGATDSFAQVLSDLKEALGAQKREKAHRDYIDLQRLVLDLMDSFDYKIHPVMYVLQTDLDEADEGAEEGDLEEVVDEIKEVEDKFSKARAILEQNGASPQVTALFNDKLSKALKAAQKRDLATTRTELAALQKLFPVLANSFGSR